MLARVETARQGDAARQKRRRERAREHRRIFGLSLNDHLVPLALRAMGHGDKALTDHAMCESLLGAWVEKQLECVTRDATDEELRVEFADIKREMVSKGIA